jgi:hypothetical protein
MLSFYSPFLLLPMQTPVRGRFFKEERSNNEKHGSGIDARSQGCCL